MNPMRNWFQALVQMKCLVTIVYSRDSTRRNIIQIFQIQNKYLAVHYEVGELSSIMWALHAATKSRLAWSRDARAARRSASAMGTLFCTQTARCVKQANTVSCFCSINFIDSECASRTTPRQVIRKFSVAIERKFHALPTSSPDELRQPYIRPYIFVACKSPISLSFWKLGIMSSGIIDRWGVRTRIVSLKQIWAFPAVSAAAVWKWGQSILCNKHITCLDNLGFCSLRPSLQRQYDQVQYHARRQ